MISSKIDKEYRGYGFGSAIGTIETIYEKYESEDIRQSICRCYRPKTKNWDEDKSLAECKFYNNEGKEIANIHLPNCLVYNYYLIGDGIVIANGGKSLILPSFRKNETKCYSLETGKVLWESPLSMFQDVFPYKDKLFCSFCGAKGGSAILDAVTGDVIKKFSNTIGLRLNERYFVNYTFGRAFIYDIQDDIFLMSSKHFEVETAYNKLDEILHTEDPNEIHFRFSDLVIDIKQKRTKKIFTDYIIKIDELISNAVPSPFKNKIPTTKEELEKKLKIESEM